MVLVKTSDGYTVDVTPKLQNASDFMRELGDGGGGGDEGDEEAVLLLHVSRRQLELAQVFVDLESAEDNPYPEIPHPLPLEDLECIVGKIFADFVRQIDMNEAVRMIVVADFLGIDKLVQILTAHIALTVAHGQFRLENLDPSLL